ncbi:MAG: flagellin [Thermotogae bacterium]|nr:flagellin [Thermotogota bacterium]
MRIGAPEAQGFWRNLYVQENRITRLINQLATARRLVSSNVDVAGTTIAQRLRARVEGYQQALNNIYDGIGMLRTAEGGVQAIQGSLSRMRELLVQAGNSTLTAQDRAAIQEEINQLVQHIRETVQNTEYNNQQLLAGGVQDMALQAGASPDQKLYITIPNLTPEELNITEIDVSTPENAAEALNNVDQAIEVVSGTAGMIGGYTNRLERAAESVANALTNLTASLSRIEDMDMAKGVVDLLRMELLRNSTTAMLSQMNVNASNVMRLLGNT